MATYFKLLVILFLLTAALLKLMAANEQEEVTKKKVVENNSQFPAVSDLNTYTKTYFDYTGLGLTIFARCDKSVSMLY